MRLLYLCAALAVGCGLQQCGATTERTFCRCSSTPSTALLKAKAAAGGDGVRALWYYTNLIPVCPTQLEYQDPRLAECTAETTIGGDPSCDQCADPEVTCESIEGQCIGRQQCTTCPAGGSFRRFLTGVTAPDLQLSAVAGSGFCASAGHVCCIKLASTCKNLGGACAATGGQCERSQCAEQSWESFFVAQLSVDSPTATIIRRTDNGGSLRPSFRDALQDGMVPSKAASPHEAYFQAYMESPSTVGKCVAVRETDCSASGETCCIDAANFTLDANAMMDRDKDTVPNWIDNCYDLNDANDTLNDLERYVWSPIDSLNCACLKDVDGDGKCDGADLSNKELADTTKFRCRVDTVGDPPIIDPDCYDVSGTPEITRSDYGITGEPGGLRDELEPQLDAALASDGKGPLGLDDSSFRRYQDITGLHALAIQRFPDLAPKGLACPAASCRSRQQCSVDNPTVGTTKVVPFVRDQFSCPKPTDVCCDYQNSALFTWRTQLVSTNGGEYDYIQFYHGQLYKLGLFKFRALLVNLHTGGYNLTGRPNSCDADFNCDQLINGDAFQDRFTDGYPYLKFARTNINNVCVPATALPTADKCPLDACQLSTGMEVAACLPCPDTGGFENGKCAGKTQCCIAHARIDNVRDGVYDCQLSGGQCSSAADADGNRLCPVNNVAYPVYASDVDRVSLSCARFEQATGDKHTCCVPTGSPSNRETVYTFAASSSLAVNLFDERMASFRQFLDKYQIWNDEIKHGSSRSGRLSG